MKILYDSSVLISAFVKEATLNKTGVFRFVENLALGLQDKQETSVSFFSSLDENDSQLWQEKILNLAHLSQIPLLNIYHPLKNQIQNLSDRLEKSSSWRKFFLKGYRESLRVLLNNSKFEEGKLEDFDLFFSPYHPVPGLIKEKKGFISFTTIHDLIPLKYPQYFKVNKKGFFDRILKKPKPWQYFFALSESTKADICHYYGIPPHRIFVINSAPTPGLFYPIEDQKKIEAIKSKYQIKGPYLLSLATLEPRKNIAFLVAAFIQLIEERPDMELTLVLTGAKGWGVDSLLEKIKKYPGRIQMTGFVEDQDLAALYNGALAFVYPSLYEGFGLPPLEAMQCAVPVIASDSSSLPEVVGDAGLYVDPTHQDDLCAQMGKIYDQPNLREELSKRSLLQAQKFSWEKNAESAHRAFSTILAQK